MWHSPLRLAVRISSRSAIRLARSDCVYSTRMVRSSYWTSPYGLGGHLKTGHTWPLQNRPTELDQDKSIYNLPMAVSANIFSQSGLKRAYTGQTWAEDMATRGRDQS